MKQPEGCPTLSLPGGGGTALEAKTIVHQDTNDRDYYIERAREERAWAGGCHDRGAALVHLKLAVEYEKRAMGIPLGRCSQS